MSKKIEGKEYPLKTIFSSEFDYHMPSYQRPYAWTEEHTETLFDDLYDFYKTQKDDNYFLGSVVLIKEENNPNAKVIDGQQRLTTLTILIAALTSYFAKEPELYNDYKEYLYEPGRRSQNLPERPRLHLRPKDQDFFEHYIQKVDLEELCKLAPEKLPDEAQQHILNNCKVLLSRIREYLPTNDEKNDFMQFLVTRCYLVTVCTPSQQSAFRVFSVLNSRGLDLMPIDIIKSDIIGQIPESKQEDYTNKWEYLEIQTSRTGFNEVFTHTRMIFAKFKAKQSLLDEFRQFVLPHTTPTGLINDILEPYSYAYSALKNCSYISAKNADKINNYLMWLNKIDNSDWMPVAIKFLSEHRNDSDYVLWFIGKLERLASYLHITGKDINKRIKRYCVLLDEMDTRPDHNLQFPLLSIELSDKEKQEFIEVLNGEIYKLTPRRRNYLILRLDSFVSDGAASYDPKVLTIEHVLPQTISSGSHWEQIWPNEEIRDKWLHRIANLVPITRITNSSAQNFDFNDKKEKYFKNKNGTSSYSLTTQVTAENDWTPAVVESRQQTLMDVLKDKWDLH